MWDIPTNFVKGVGQQKSWISPHFSLAFGVGLSNHSPAPHPNPRLEDETMATDSLRIDGREWTAAELAAWTEPLHVSGYLHLRGYAHPLPAALTSKGKLR